MINKVLLITLIFLISATKPSAQYQNLSHELFVAAGATQPTRTRNNHEGLYDKKYNKSFVAKANYSLKYKWISLGIEGLYFKGDLIETEHIAFDGNSVAYSFTIPISVYLYTDEHFRYSIYAAGGMSQFNTLHLLLGLKC